MATTPEGRVKKRVKKLLDARKPGVWYFMPMQNGMGVRVLDYIGCAHGRFFSIETKAPGGRLTPYQSATRAGMEAARGTVFHIDGAPDELARLTQWLDNSPMIDAPVRRDAAPATRLLDVRAVYSHAPESPSGMPPQMLTPTVEAEPFFVPERNLILLPDVDPWRRLADGHAPKTVYRGQTVYVMRNQPHLHQLLRNQGLRVPAPILHDHYDWCGQEPYRSQRDTAALLSSNQRAFVLSDLGTGKTLAALMAIDWLILRGHAMRALIIAPLSTLDYVWREEIARRAPRLRPTILHGSREQRLKRLADPTWNVGIVNTDGIKVFPEELRAAGFDIIVIDEIASFRDHTTDRWKTLRDLVLGVPYVWGMTGAPTPNGPWEAYGPAKLLVPERVPMSFKRFREEVAVEVRQGIWRPRPEGKDRVFAVLQPSVRYKRADVVELPPCQHLRRQTGLGEEQLDAIDQLRRHFMAEFAEGTVVAQNAAVMVGKLLQAACGALYTSEKEVIELDPAARVDAAWEVVQEAEGKVILFAYYRHIVQLLHRELAKQLPAHALAMVHGEVGQDERARLFRRFQDEDSPLRLLIAQPTTMAHGLTLTAANTILWYHPILSLETYEQANARITRPGQVREQLIVHLWATGLEQRLYDALAAKSNMQAAVLKLFDHDLR